LGGYQTQPFIMHPAELKVSGDMVGTASVYRVSKGWLDELHGPTPAIEASANAIS